MFRKILLISLLLIALITQGTAQTLQYPDSPFGFIINPSPYAGLDSSLNAMSALGAQWIRLSGSNGIVWDKIEPTSGNYNWSNTDNIISKCYAKGINILATVVVANAAHQAVFGYLPPDTNAYSSFLQKAVERYDGDGINDAPGSPVVDVWQINNEIDISQVWLDSLKNYAELMKISYRAIKQANPNAKVALAGMASNMSKYSQVLGYLQGSIYFDIFDFHWHAMSGGNYRVHKTSNPNVNYYLDQYLNDIRSNLNSTGYNNAEIWVTEMSISDINPQGQTETLQAIDLLKRYVYPVRKGVSVICWGTLYENNNFGGISGNGNYFNTQGLINNPLNDGDSSKKLAYYTYKKMIEILEGSDWSAVTTVKEDTVNKVYIYKFTKQGKSIWVAWNDSSVTRTITISGITQNRVRATEAVPKYESGKDVIDYAKAFQTDTLVVTNGAVALTLGQRPVFIEPLTLTSVEEKGENVPKEFLLHQNYPNPFNPTTTIRFQIADLGLRNENQSAIENHKSKISLKVFDVLGREVATLVNEELNPGEHSVVFDAKGLASGIYFYRLSSGTFVQQKKMVVMR